LCLLLISQTRIIVVVVGLVCELVKNVCVSQLVQSSVVTMKERLLVDLVRDCHEQVIMVRRERTDESEERSHA
jgi:hypothetical protein